MQWFCLTVENRRNVTKFQKALSFLAELREYHHKYIYKLVNNFSGYGVSITSVRYLDLYRVTLCTCSIAFRCSQFMSFVLNTVHMYYMYRSSNCH